MAHLPTPIHFLPRLSRELGKRIYVWRDDMTGFFESGNKIRKLEYLAAEAVQKKASVLLTCGGPQSNHARATAFIARRLGLGISILVRKPKEGLSANEPRLANFLLNRILGADLTFIEFAEYKKAGAKYDSFLMEHAETLRDNGETPYLIPEGGSCALGCFGYLTAVSEMLKTWQVACGEKKSPDHLFLALGSGGTYAGLHLGLEEAGLSPSLLFAINVCDDAKYFETRIHGLFDDFENIFQRGVRDRNVHIGDGYVGGGYARASDDELKFYIEIARKEGLMLDPCYTGKAFLGMVTEIKKTPSRFGTHMLFLHSGGGFGNFAYVEQFDRCLESRKF